MPIAILPTDYKSPQFRSARLIWFDFDSAQQNQCLQSEKHFKLTTI